MNLFDNSRRLFIAGAASGAALLGTVAFVKTIGKSSVAKGLGDPTQLAGGKAGISEADLWTGMIDQPFTIAGAGKTVSARLTKVKRQAVVGKLPAQLRQQPMALTFTLDRGFDTTGEAIYAVRASGGGKTDLFLQRGADSTGTRLVAILG